MTWRESRIHRGLIIEYFSAAWMLVEVVASLGAGLIAGSFALIAFGGDSLVELLSSVAVIGHLREDWRGSTSLGKMTSRFANFLLISLIPIIGIGALYSYLVFDLRPRPTPIGIGIAVGALIVMSVLWLEKKRIGKETTCLPLSIDAVESATCFFMSFALLGGLAVNYFFGISWVDYLATAIILVFVGKEALESYREISE